MGARRACHARSAASAGASVSWKRWLRARGTAAGRPVTDVWEDAGTTSGRPAEHARAAAVAAGTTINGLPIINDRANFGRPAEADLDLYYERNVIGGPGAFMILATSFEAFGSALLSKLIKEIAGDDAIARR